MLNDVDRQRCRFMATLAVCSRRRARLDPEAIRREVLAAGIRAIEEHVADLSRQESMFVELVRCVDTAIRATAAGTRHLGFEDNH